MIISRSKKNCVWGDIREKTSPTSSIESISCVSLKRRRTSFRSQHIPFVSFSSSKLLLVLILVFSHFHIIRQSCLSLGGFCLPFWFWSSRGVAVYLACVCVCVSFSRRCRHRSSPFGLRVFLVGGMALGTLVFGGPRQRLELLLLTITTRRYIHPNLLLLSATAAPHDDTFVSLVLICPVVAHFQARLFFWILDTSEIIIFYAILFWFRKF
jgi:hypothetical protein